MLPRSIRLGPRIMTPSTDSAIPKSEVKILMLHGFTQSGAVFHAKTRALQKILTKVLKPLVPILIYPTGPNRLLPQDVPGYEGADASGAANPDEPPHEPDTWAWWRKDDGSGEYLYLEKGIETIARAIRDAGGIDGVCGFSQGGAATGIVAAALEAERQVPGTADWVRQLREANDGRPVDFAVSYSGFWATPASLRFLYEPKIRTPMMHFLGSLDTVVDEDRSRGFVDRCDNATVIVHPGGHHVPVSREWAMPLAAFIKQHALDSAPRVAL